MSTTIKKAVRLNNKVVAMITVIDVVAPTKEELAIRRADRMASGIALDKCHFNKSSSNFSRN